jgi:hypothetical protein
MNDQFEATALPPTPPATRSSGPSIGTIFLGGIVAMFGVLWLLDGVGAIDSPWHAILPGMLIIVGIALVLTARGGSHAGLIVLGSIITVVLTVTSMIDIPLAGGIGERTALPLTIADVEETYELSMGQQTIDLRRIDFPDGETRVEARVGMGELVIRVPAGTEVRADFRVGIGDASVLATSRSGLGIRDDYRTPGFDTAQQRLVLDVSVGIGSLVVRYDR